MKHITSIFFVTLACASLGAHAMQADKATELVKKIEPLTVVSLLRTHAPLPNAAINAIEARATRNAQKIIDDAVILAMAPNNLGLSIPTLFESHIVQHLYKNPYHKQDTLNYNDIATTHLIVRTLQTDTLYTNMLKEGKTRLAICLPLIQQRLENIAKNTLTKHKKRKYPTKKLVFEKYFTIRQLQQSFSLTNQETSHLHRYAIQHACATLDSALHTGLTENNILESLPRTIERALQTQINNACIVDAPTNITAMPIADLCTALLTATITDTLLCILQTNEPCKACLAHGTAGLAVTLPALQQTLIHKVKPYLHAARSIKKEQHDALKKELFTPIEKAFL